MNQLLSRISAIVSDRGGVARALKLALDRPAAVAQAVRRLAEKDWRTLAGGSQANANKLRVELEQSGLIDALNTRLRDEFSVLAGKKVRGKEAVPGGMRALHAELLWVIVRSQNLKTIVETGVCNGLSSAVLLEAIAKNGSGLLVSVDLPEFTDAKLNKFDVWDGKGGAAIPAGKDVGWLVRPEHRPSWRLELGPCQELLPPLLEELSPIDLFIHDSEHSYENQLFEFRVGFEALRPGGVLVATDITWSDAFDHFWLEIKGSNAERAFVDPSCAIVIKR
ncbi:class I SAM-dependent methyltransferase [Parasphingorhabdus sp.]|uniref:class I SAM-dependent methyltransferase n=1 Tax=Parasphingorhabdus sp. TaxID=2709688 RepID=UPI002B269E7A|nr:class I SAM-dependent methyltransferase [Parasphingorhabdus sp.]|tara:strand:- start:12441 stop:13277 length:837 start_codon:yes stop_codon:yes gene_type:complete